jgi:hypothetical protein
MAMLFVMWSHFGDIYFRFQSDSHWPIVLCRISMIASPWFSKRTRAARRG